MNRGGYMDSIKLTIDGKEEEIYLDMPDEAVEDNHDMVSQDNLEDTLNLDELKRVFGSENDEQ